MDNKKLTTVIEGIFLAVLGILVIVCGIGTTVDIYFGVVSLVAGLLLLCFAGYAISKKMPLPVGFVIMASILITVAVALFAQKLSFAMLIGLMIFIIMGLGFGLAALGIYAIVKKAPVYGIGLLVIGALLVLFTALYLGIPDFQKVFWYIVGGVMIALGVVVVVLAFVDPKKLQKK